jgi:hypothetical protein
MRKDDERILNELIPDGKLAGRQSDELVERLDRMELVLNDMQVSYAALLNMADASGKLDEAAKAIHDVIVSVGGLSI